jgi:hypothetical protein
MNSFSCYSIRKSHYMAIIVLSTLAIVSIVGYGVFKFSGKPPSGMKYWDTYFLIAFFIFSALAGIYYFVKRFEVTVETQKNSLMLEVKDPALDVPLIIRDSFTLSLQWHHEETGRRNIKSKRAYATVCDLRGQPIVTFTRAYGVLQDPPEGFEHIDLFSEQTRLILAPLVYSTEKTADLVGILQDYLEGKS